MNTEYIKQTINSLSTELINRQLADGRWNFCFETGIMSDAYMLLLMKTLDVEDPKLQDMLVERILSEQTELGTWKAFPDEVEGNPSATTEACLALLYTNSVKISDLEQATAFLERQIDEINVLTRVVLAIFGHYSWDCLPKLPVEFIFLSPNAPINFLDFVGYARTHLAPIMLLQDRKLTITLPNHQEVEKWLPKAIPCKSLFAPIDKLSQKTRTLLPRLHHQAVLLVEAFLLKRIEPDGTLYNYSTTTFLMIFALLSLGYPKNHPIIQNAYFGLRSYLCPLPNGGVHIQETNSNVWDTGLSMHALQVAGLTPCSSTIKKGVSYLLSRQQSHFGDWAIHNSYARPGGWGFSDLNTINPDVDDTTISLRALTPSTNRKKVKKAWERGLKWLCSMQNRDGGWPAFEKNTGKRWQALLPNLGSQIWGDPSMPDLTGRTLEFIGNYTTISPKCLALQRAKHWLIQHQQSDGSWFGRWGICYIYGTWAVLTGLQAVKVPRDHPAVDRGIEWLLSIQQPDGGWGESCYSDQQQYYIPLSFSTPVQTAWALDALIAYHEKPTAEIETGVYALLQLVQKRGKAWEYPVGSGLAGQFYVYYHSYPYVWPLTTLSHYLTKYGTKSFPCSYSFSYS